MSGMDDEEPAARSSALLDDVAFRSFYDRALPVVYGYFYKRCGGDAEVAAELTQETFLSAVRGLRQGANVGAPLPWVVTIARSRLIDYYRRRSVRNAGDSVWMLGDVPEVGSQASSLAEERLIDALADLPHHYRLALVLRHVDGLSVSEVSHQMGKGVRATESLLARARVALSKRYGEESNG